MKGFGDTRENVPCLVELVDEGILDMSAVDRDDDGQSGAPAC